MNISFTLLIAFEQALSGDRAKKGPGAKRGGGEGKRGREGEGGGVSSFPFPLALPLGSLPSPLSPRPIYTSAGINRAETDKPHFVS